MLYPESPEKAAGLYSTLGGVDLQDVIRALHKEDRAELVQDLQRLKHEHAFVPASLPPSALPSRQSPSRPADASSEFVVPEVSAAQEGSEPNAPVVGSGAAVEESIKSGEDFGTQEEHATDTPRQERRR